MTLKINRQTIFKRCLKALCPNCGHSKIAHSWIVIHEKCPECSMPIKRGNGFYIGPICLNYGVIAFGIISQLTSYTFLKGSIDYKDSLQTNNYFNIAALRNEIIAESDFLKIIDE